MHNYGMYIIAIGWLYVTLLVAINEASVIAGIVSFLFTGLLPCGLLLWISGTKVRRQRRAYREQMAAAREAESPPENSKEKAQPESGKD